MTKPEQLAASVRQRLKNLTGKSDFQTTLVLYALERDLFWAMEWETGQLADLVRQNLVLGLTVIVSVGAENEHLHIQS